MKAGLIASALLHVAVLALVLFGVPFWRPKLPDVNVIPVEVISDAEFAEITTPKPNEQKEEEKPADVPPPPPKPAAPPPPPASADAVPPLEDVKPKPKPKAEAKVEPPQPRPTERITPRTKPKPPTRFDTSRIAALLDKSKKPEPQEEAPQPKFDIDKLAKDLGKTQVASDKQLATLKDMIKSQFNRCWDIPAGMKGAEKMKVRVHILLQQDGSLIGTPEVMNKERYSDPDGAQFDVAARAAINAVYKCTPLKLPRELYSEWHDLTYNFDPSQMLDVN